MGKFQESDIALGKSRENGFPVEFRFEPVVRARAESQLRLFFQFEMIGDYAFIVTFPGSSGNPVEIDRVIFPELKDFFRTRSFMEGPFFCEMHFLSLS